MFRPMIAALLVWALSSNAIFGQSESLCSTCACLWEKAEKARLSGQFKPAIEWYNAFVVCDPASKTKATQQIVGIYQAVEAQKENEKQARLEADRQRNRALKAQSEAEAANLFNKNISATLLMAKKDPTIALAMAEYLYREHPEESAAGAVLKQIASDESEGMYYSVLNGHTRSVTCVGFFNDNRRIATGSADSTLRIWDLEGRLLKTVHFDKSVKTIAVSRNNLLAVALGQDSSGVALMDETGSILRRFSSAGKAIKCLGFAPDGMSLTAGFDNIINTWKTSGMLVSSIRLAKDKKLVDLQYAPDGQTFFAVADSRQTDAIIYQITQEGLLRDSFTYQFLTSNAVAVSANGQLLMSGGDNNDALIWNLADRNQGLLLEGHIGNVTDVGIAPSDTIFATASQDGSLLLWGMNGKVIRRLHGHDRQVNALAFSPDGNWLVSAGSDKTLKVWRMYNTAARTFPSQAAGKVIESGFCADQKHFFTAWEFHSIAIWDMDGTLIHPINDPNEHLLMVKLSGSGKWLLSGGSDGWCTVWDTSGSQNLSLPRQNSAIIGGAFSNNEKNIVTADAAGQIKWWDWNMKVVREFKSILGEIEGFALSPDNRHFAVFVNNSDTGVGEVALYNAAGQLLEHLQYPKLIFTSMTFTADSKTLCLGTYTGELLWWSLQHSKPEMIKAADFCIYTLTPVSRQNWLLVGSGDHTLTIRDSQGAVVREFYENGGWVTAAAGSTDGRYVICANLYGRIIVRDLLEMRRWAKNFSVEELKASAGLTLQKAAPRPR